MVKKHPILVAKDGFSHKSQPILVTVTLLLLLLQLVISSSRQNPLFWMTFLPLSGFDERAVHPPSQ
jgi:hypothetical protein